MLIAINICRVITYVILSGTMPFPNTSLIGLERAIRRCELSFTSPYWSLVSPIGKDFIKFLIHADQRTRPSAVQALDHAWLSPPQPLPSSSSTSISTKTRTVTKTVTQTETETKTKTRTTTTTRTRTKSNAAPPSSYRMRVNFTASEVTSSESETEFEPTLHPITSEPDLPGLRENVGEVARARWRAALVSSPAVARLREAGQQAERRRTESERERKIQEEEREKEREIARARSLSLKNVCKDVDNALPSLPADALEIIERWSSVDFGLAKFTLDFETGPSTSSSKSSIGQGTKQRPPFRPSHRRGGMGPRRVSTQNSTASSSTTYSGLSMLAKTTSTRSRTTVDPHDEMELIGEEMLGWKSFSSSLTVDV